MLFAMAKKIILPILGLILLPLAPIFGQTSIDINCGGVKIGTFDISTYQISGQGVEIEACFHKNAGCPMTCCHKFRTFQIVYSDNNPPQDTAGHNLNVPYIDPPNGGYSGDPWDGDPYYNEGGDGTNDCPYPYYFYDRPQLKRAMRAPEQNNDLKFETWIVCVDETNKKICGLAHIRWGYKLVGGVVTQLYAIDGTNSQTDAQIRTALSNSGFSAWSFSRNAWDCCPLAGERALDREDYHCKADSANDLHIRYYSDTRMRLTAHYDSTFRSFTATPNADSSSWECTWAGDTIYKCHWISVGAQFSQRSKNWLMKRDINWTWNGTLIRAELPGAGFSVEPPYGPGPVTYTIFNNTDVDFSVIDLEVGIFSSYVPLEAMHFLPGDIGPPSPDIIALPAGGTYSIDLIPPDGPYYVLAQGKIIGPEGDTTTHFVQQHEHPVSLATFAVRHNMDDYIPTQGSPVGTSWMSLYPATGEIWQIIDWHDNGDEILSYCDNIQLYNEELMASVWEHIERITPTIEIIGPDPDLTLYLESIADNETIEPISKPIGTMWHEVFPDHCRLFLVEAWEDNGTSILDSGDFILMQLLSGPDSGQTIGYTVWDYATDIISDPIRPCSGTCGDANDDGIADVSDAVWVINYVFVGGEPPQPVLACGDANGDATVDISDAVWLINYIFVGGETPGDCSPGAWGTSGGDCCPFTD